MCRTKRAQDDLKFPTREVSQEKKSVPHKIVIIYSISAATMNSTAITRSYLSRHLRISHLCISGNTHKFRKEQVEFLKFSRAIDETTTRRATRTLHLKVSGRIGLCFRVLHTFANYPTFLLLTQNRMNKVNEAC